MMLSQNWIIVQALNTGAFSTNMQHSSLFQHVMGPDAQDKA